MKVKIATRHKVENYNNEIRVSRGIFQGAALSTLWFILFLNLISKGCVIRHNPQSHTFSQLFYVNNLKLYTEWETSFEKFQKWHQILVETLKCNSESINFRDYCKMGFKHIMMMIIWWMKIMQLSAAYSVSQNGTKVRSDKLEDPSAT